MTARNEPVAIIGGSVTVGDVVERYTLFAELKSDQDGARKTALRRTLDIGTNTGNGVHNECLESTVDAVGSDTDALEASFDTNGTAETFSKSSRPV